MSCVNSWRKAHFVASSMCAVQALKHFPCVAGVRILACLCKVPSRPARLAGFGGGLQWQGPSIGRDGTTTWEVLWQFLTRECCTGFETGPCHPRLPAQAPTLKAALADARAAANGPHMACICHPRFGSFQTSPCRGDLGPAQSEWPRRECGQGPACTSVADSDPKVQCPGAGSAGTANYLAGNRRWVTEAPLDILQKA